MMNKENEFFIEKIKDHNQIFEFKGNLTYSNSNEIKQLLLRQFQPNKSKYILDLSNINSVDSTGMGIILSFSKIVEDNKSIVLVIKDDFIQELFMIAKLDQLFQIVKSAEEIE